MMFHLLQQQRRQNRQKKSVGSSTKKPDKQGSDSDDDSKTNNTKDDFEHDLSSFTIATKSDKNKPAKKGEQRVEKKPSAVTIEETEVNTPAKGKSKSTNENVIKTQVSKSKDTSDKSRPKKPKNKKNKNLK